MNSSSNMRNLLKAGAIAGLAALTSGPVLAQDSTTPAPTTTPAVNVDASTVLATVNGTDITMGHVILLRTQLPQQYLSAPDDVLFQGILNQLIDQTLLGATVTKETLEMKLALENEARALRAASAIDTMLQGGPGDAELKAAYDKAVAAMPPVQEYNASHILVATEDEAKAIVKDLNDGADFAELAKQKSTGPSGPNGGDLGWFSAGTMVPEFETAVTAMKVGEISAPVQTQFGWHVIKLNDERTKPAPTMDEMKDQLTKQIQSAALEAKIAKLREGATITTNTDGVDPAAMRNLDLLKQ